jgi:hypothetical protein
MFLLVFTAQTITFWQKFVCHDSVQLDKPYSKKSRKKKMIEIKVPRNFVWPVRGLFIVLALVITNMIVDKYLQGYIISTGTTKYEYGSAVYFTHMLKYIVFDFVLILFAFRTVEKNDLP